MKWLESIINTINHITENLRLQNKLYQFRDTMQFFECDMSKYSDEQIYSAIIDFSLIINDICAHSDNTQV